MKLSLECDGKCIFSTELGNEGSMPDLFAESFLNNSSLVVLEVVLQRDLSLIPRNPISKGFTSMGPPLGPSVNF